MDQETIGVLIKVGVLAGVFLVILIGGYFVSKNSLGGKYIKKKKPNGAADDELFDPETGMQLTLEEAESGIYCDEGYENRVVSEEDLLSYYSQEQIPLIRCFNFLHFKELETYFFNEKETELLNNIKMLGSYGNWHYWKCFVWSKNVLIFFPSVKLKLEHNVSGYHETQIMAWVKTKDQHGHQIAMPERIIDKLVDLIDKENPFTLEGFQVTSLISSPDFQSTVKVLQPFKSLKNVDIELYRNNLFIKTSRTARTEDLDMLIDVIEQVKSEFK